MTIFMDIELISVMEAEPPDAYAVTFDVIYSGETWCRSLVMVDTVTAAGLGGEEYPVVSVARDALLESLATEARPVSLHLRLTSAGVTVVGRGSPGERGPLG